MFDRGSLPEPLAYYEAQGLSFQERRGRWRTTACPFHGGSDSLRINVATGAFVCMAGCGARGGDLVAFHMALHGVAFTEAARALGAWTETGEPHRPRRPKALPAHEALELIERESLVVALEAARMANGHPITNEIKARLLRAAAAIHHAREATR